MNYYALQVKTNSEKKFVKLFTAMNPGANFPFHFPQRHLDIRRKGVFKSALVPVFPGYVFIEAEETKSICNELFSFKQTDGFFRFLKSNREITPLQGRDLDIVSHFLKMPGSVAGKSKVYFNDKSRIVVMEGPLKGLEGRIIKVDKRKKRAKIVLDLYEDSFSIDLSFEVIERKEK